MGSTVSSSASYYFDDLESAEGTAGDLCTTRLSSNNEACLLAGGGGELHPTTTTTTTTTTGTCTADLETIDAPRSEPPSDELLELLVDEEQPQRQNLVVEIGECRDEEIVIIIIDPETTTTTTTTTTTSPESPSESPSSSSSVVIVNTVKNVDEEDLTESSSSSSMERKFQKGDPTTRAAMNLGIMVLMQKVERELEDHPIPSVPIEGPITQRIYHIGYPSWMILSAALIMLVLLGAVINELLRVTVWS
jgi:hypothetical protein